MKSRLIRVSGKVSSSGQLLMPMGEINDFISKHKNATIIAEFRAYEPQSSKAFKGYYYNYIVPSFQEAIWQSGERLSKESTEKRLREMSPIMLEEIVNETTGEWSSRVRTINELSNAELKEHIETLMQIAAEEYSFYIEDINLL